MTAQEMFKELGFCKYENEDEIQYRRSESVTYTRIINFDLKRKLIFSENSRLSIVGINALEFNAIYQQMKELGWLDEY